MVFPHHTHSPGEQTVAHTLSASIARTPTLTQPGLSRSLRRWLVAELGCLRPQIAQAAVRCGAERYRKHFHAFAHACLLLFHAFSGAASLRQSYATFALCPGLVALSGLAKQDQPAGERLGVSFSQFAQSNTSRPAAFLGLLIPSLVERVRHLGPAPREALPPDLCVIDSTFLRLSLQLASWLPCSSKADIPGVRLQVQYSPALDLPEGVVVTDNRTNDCQGLDVAVLEDPGRLRCLAGRTLVLDLGYYSHRRFSALRQGGVHFVSRLHPQASLQLEEDLPLPSPLPGLPAGRIAILADQQVTLGSANNRAGAVLKGLRLVTARVLPLPKAAGRGAQPLTYQLLSDRWDLEAEQVVQAYLWRWQIELFFRWLKSQIHLPRLLGYSPNAVELSVWLGLITHLLTVLAMNALGLNRRTPALVRQIGHLLGFLCPNDLVAAANTPYQYPFPGGYSRLQAPT